MGKSGKPITSFGKLALKEMLTYVKVFAENNVKLLIKVDKAKTGQGLHT
jgi:hypothetical protein